MRRFLFASVCASALACGTILSSQQLPSVPAKAFGTSVTGSFEGWFDKPDGSHVFLVGYYNRNIQRDMDVPIGPANRIEPGGPDMGQPTHFVASRQTGVFTVTVPKAFTRTQRLTWTLIVNGVTTSIPLHLNPDYIISPFKDAAVGNTPPLLHLLDENAPPLQGPVNALADALARTATVAGGLDLPFWVTDDAKYTSGTNAPMRNPAPPVTVAWSQYRGPAGGVTFSEGKPKLNVLAGGSVGGPFKGTAAVHATFSEPGDYVLQIVVNDYSGPGGGGEICCWTNALVKVRVAP